MEWPHIIVFLRASDIHSYNVAYSFQHRSTLPLKIDNGMQMIDS
jgi:hypothetical protein